MIVTVKNGVPVARKMTRIVEGARGAYMEFAREDMYKENLYIPARQAWRVTPDWITKVYYVWYEIDGAKLYLQQKLVDYADYLIGYYYVDPLLVKEVDELNDVALGALADYYDELSNHEARV